MRLFCSNAKTSAGVVDGMVGVEGDGFVGTGLLSSDKVSIACPCGLQPISNKNKQKHKNNLFIG
jgi:hypothetical protein